jgi:hypothetical protein
MLSSNGIQTLAAVTYSDRIELVDWGSEFLHDEYEYELIEYEYVYDGDGKPARTNFGINSEEKKLVDARSLASECHGASLSGQLHKRLYPSDQCQKIRNSRVASHSIPTNRPYTTNHK